MWRWPTCSPRWEVPVQERPGGRDRIVREALRPGADPLDGRVEGHAVQQPEALPDLVLDPARTRRRRGPEFGGAVARRRRRADRDAHIRAVLASAWVAITATELVSPPAGFALS